MFRAGAKIYIKAMLQHDIQGSIPIILVEDGIKVKARISWAQRWDSLLGFCSPNLNTDVSPITR